MFQQEHLEAVGLAVQYELIADKHAVALGPPENNRSDAADQSVIPPHTPHVFSSYGHDTALSNAVCAVARA